MDADLALMVSPLIQTIELLIYFISIKECYPVTSVKLYTISSYLMSITVVAQ